MIPRKVKRPLAAALALGPWSSRRLGPPKRGLIDTPPTDPRAGIAIVQDLEIDHPSPPPPNPVEWPHIEPELLAKLHRTLCPEIKALRIGDFRQARYFQPTFAVIDAKDRILHEFSQGWEEKARGRNYAFEQISLRHLHVLRGRALLLDARTHSQNYFHWLIEAIPRIAFAQDVGWTLADFDHILVSNPRRPFHQETFALTGIDPAKIVDTAAHPHVECDVLVAVSDLRMFAYDASIVALKKLFTAQLETSGWAERTKIFVSRSDSDHRRLLNEEEVFSILRPLGFTRVTLSTLSMAEQASLFAQAKVVVSTHGAALANLVFCERGTTIVEIHHPNYTLGLYWQIAQRLGLRYGAILGTAAGDIGDPRHADMTMNADSLADYVTRFSMVSD